VLYVDTSVIVTPFLKNRSAEVIARCDAFLEAVAQRDEPVATSWLTWDEVVWSLGRSAAQFDRRRAAELSDALLQVEFLRFLPVDRATNTCRPTGRIRRLQASLSDGGVRRRVTSWAPAKDARNTSKQWRPDTSD